MKNCKIDLFSEDCIEQLDKVINLNYIYPRIYVKNGKVYMYLTLSCVEQSNEDKYKTMTKVVDLIYSFLNIEEKCLCTLLLSKTTISNMLKLLMLHKETSGSFELDKVIDIDGDNRVYELSLKEDSLQGGSLDEVYETNTEYNFHTHPVPVYIKRGVHYAWPSIKDLYSILENKEGVFHCLISAEGLYFVMRSRKGIPSTNNLKKYNILYPNPKNKDYYPQTPKEYIEKLSRIRKKVFNISFFSWKEIINSKKIDLKLSVE